MSLKASSLPLVLVLFLAVQTAFASSASRPELEIEGSIAIESNFEESMEFNIVFKFMLKPEGHSYDIIQQQLESLRSKAKSGDSEAIATLNRFNQKIDTAYLLADSNIEFLSPASWSGKLEPNKENRLTVKARLLYKVQTRVEGVIGSACERGIEANTIQCTFNSHFASDVLFEEISPDKKTPKTDTLYIDSTGKAIIIKQIHELRPSIIESPKVIEKTDGPTPGSNPGINKPEKKPQRDNDIPQKTGGPQLAVGWCKGRQLSSYDQTQTL
jgi:hypothetical protein